MHLTNCLNCGSNLGSGYKFCATCGQKAATHRLNFHEIGHDALHYITHADKGIFTSIEAACPAAGYGGPGVYRWQADKILQTGKLVPDCWHPTGIYGHQLFI